MKVAALFDVHGNVYALEAVLADVAGEVDVVLFGGDIASGPFPRETLELLRSLPHARCIRGNADERASPVRSEAAVAGRRWVEARMSAEEVAWLAEQPFSWSADDTLYVHANPIDVYEFVAPRTPDARVAELLAGVGERRVVTGHVHLQFEREVAGIRWIGAGSVGCPYVETDPAAEWVCVDGGEVAFRRTEYDVEHADAAIRASGYPRAAEYLDRAQGARWIATAA